jgi:hypothetical protein
MLLGFKKRFAAYVEEGSKTHTIRARRKIAPRVGETCHCYEALRTKHTRLLGRFVCVGVQDITLHFHAGSPVVRINEVLLSLDETEALFWRDGFRANPPSSMSQAALFWGTNAKFSGHIIHWDFDRRPVHKGDFVSRASHGGKRANSGGKPTCLCDLVSCGVCRHRNLRRAREAPGYIPQRVRRPDGATHSRPRRRFSVIGPRQPIPRYDWDRTAIDEDWYAIDPEVN